MPVLQKALKLELKSRKNQQKINFDALLRLGFQRPISFMGGAETVTGSQISR